MSFLMVVLAARTNWWIRFVTQQYPGGRSSANHLLLFVAHRLLCLRRVMTAAISFCRRLSHGVGGVDSKVCSERPLGTDVGIRRARLPAGRAGIQQPIPG